jgi:hypothetical protein
MNLKKGINIMLKKAFVMTSVFVIIGLSVTQAQDLTYFVNKWSIEQKKTVFAIVQSWLGGDDQAVLGNNIVSLVRIEALLASVQAANVPLYLPAFSNILPTELPGELLRLFLVERKLPFGPEHFFIHRKFTVAKFEPDKLEVNDIESDKALLPSKAQEEENVSK